MPPLTNLPFIPLIGVIQVWFYVNWNVLGFQIDWTEACYYSNFAQKCIKVFSASIKVNEWEQIISIPGAITTSVILGNVPVAQSHKVVAAFP